MVQDEIDKCEKLLSTAQVLAGTIGRHNDGIEYWFDRTQIPELQKCITSIYHMIQRLAEPSSIYLSEFDKIIIHRDVSNGDVSYKVFQRIIGLFDSFLDNLKDGSLRKIEYEYISLTFDDFLDHASDFHKSNKPMESAILASIVYEDAMRKLAEKYGLNRNDRLETIIDNLAIFTPTKKKQLKVYAGVRNDALHADWEKLEIRSVGEMISGVRNLIGDHL